MCLFLLQLMHLLLFTAPFCLAESPPGPCLSCRFSSCSPWRNPQFTTRMAWPSWPLLPFPFMLLAVSESLSVISISYRINSVYHQVVFSCVLCTKCGVCMLCFPDVCPLILRYTYDINTVRKDLISSPSVSFSTV